MAGWDVLKPEDTDLIRNGPTLFRQDKTTLKTQLQVEHHVLNSTGVGGEASGRHKFLSGKIADRPVGSPEVSGMVFFNYETNSVDQVIGDGTWIQMVNGPPPGTIMPWAGTDVVPLSGWYPCDGSALSRVDYSVLFSVIGTQYGAGDGVNTFNVPNLKGRVIVGFDAGQVAFDTQGETGGAYAATLTENELPAHSHGVADAGHSHVINDPQHAHTIADPSHTHSLNNPAHSHGVTDPQHGHGTTVTPHSHSMELSIGGADTGNPNALITAGQKAVSRSGATGMINNGQDGVAVHNGATGVSVDATATTVGANAGATGIVATQNNGTGITTAVAGAGTSTQPTGSGQPFSVVQPYMTLRYIIKV